MQRKPWSDVRVRQAVSMAINRDEMIDKTLSGSGTVSGPIATGFGTGISRSMN
jgi:ABC-type transport system substrate-binding protein